jgi:Integral membrane protein TerC family
VYQNIIFIGFSNGLIYAIIALTLIKEFLMIFFPFAEYWSIYVGFTVFVLLMLALDLGVFHKKLHVVSIKEASIWTAAWIGLAFIFNIAFFFYSKNKFSGVENFDALYGVSAEQMAKNLSFEFLTGFIIEKTLAIDNIFIFALVFSFFKIPKLYQHRILFWGILGALFFSCSLYRSRFSTHGIQDYRSFLRIAFNVYRNKNGH